MLGRNSVQTDFHVGKRVVAGNGTSSILEGEDDHLNLRVEIVEQIDMDAVGRGENAMMVLRSGDETRNVLLCSTRVIDDLDGPSAWRTMWTDPLPENDGQALAFVRAAHARDARQGRETVLLLWVVAATAGGRGYAHLLTENSDAADASHATGNGLHHSIHALAIEVEDDLESGSLVAGRLKDAYLRDGIIVHKFARCHLIASNLTIEQAANIVPRPAISKGRFAISNFGGWHQVHNEEEQALARSEPSESLVLGWMEGGRLEVQCLASTGIAFWMNDDPASYAETSIPGPGLWMWRNVRRSGHTDHEGVYDESMEGEWQRATIADVTHMIGSVDDCANEIREYTGEDGDPSLVVEGHLGLSGKDLAILKG